MKKKYNTGFFFQWGSQLIIFFLMQALQAKQRYLRQHISQKQYQEFSAYIEQQVGNEDIEGWSYQFVVEIVADFNRSRLDDSSPLETSFYNYQQKGEREELPQPVIINNLKEKVENKDNKDQIKDSSKVVENRTKGKQDLKGSKAETTSMDVKPNSALNLFDSVFDASNKSAKNGQYPQKQPSKQVSNLSQFNAFDSSEFWSSAGIGKNAVATHKLSKSNADFGGFDNFWSQTPSKSVQEFKSGNLEPQQPKSSRVPPTHQKNQKFKNGNAIPSFEELLLQMKEEIKEDKKVKEEKRPQKQTKQQKQQRQVKQVKQGKQSKAPSPYQKKNYPQQRIATPVINIKKVAYDGQIIFKADFKDSVKCFPSTQRKQLKGKQLSVAIQSHQIVNRTFLMPDYVMYSLRVRPINTLIHRNYEDFTKLRAVLGDFYPGTKLAFLQGTSWFGATGVQQVKRQKAMLQFFMEDLLRNKEVCNSRFVEDFLMLPQHKRIKRKLQEFDKLQRPKSIEELCLLQGKVQVNLSEQQRQYHQHLKKYQQKMVDFLERQEKLTQILAEQYRTIGITLEQMIDLTTAIIQETKRFNERVYGLQVSGVQQVFKIVRGCYAQQKKLVAFNHDLATSSHLPFLSYQRNNTKQLDELINNQQAFLRSYLKRAQSEKIDTSIPYTSDKLAYSKVGVGIQSKNLTVLKYQAAFFGNQLCHEAKRTFEALAAKFRQLWGRTALRKREHCLKSLDFWKTLEVESSFS